MYLSNIMTETSYRYGIIPSLPVASPPTYLLLIDSRVSNYQDIINAKQPGVYHIVFDAPTRPTRSTKLIKDVEEKIAALGVGAFTSIGLVQHNDEKPVYEMFGRTSDIIKPRISAVERDDPDFQSWNSVALFITMLRQNYGIEYFDMMACALYSNPDWKYIIDKLTTLTGVTVRASTDDTGAASLGGDWFLESHTGVNLKDIYFTDAIESYNGLLYTAPSQSSATTKKLILIDNRIKDIDVIINAMNDDTYCLVFNYFYDTPASILSKLRFLNSDNRYILDHFHYETPEIPTQIDASGNQCTPCDDFDITEIQLLPGTLQNEYIEYTTSAAAAANDSSGNGGVWPFYSESTNITIQKPVFFQRAKIGETTESVVYPSTEVSTVILNYKPRPMVLVSDLDEFYELGQASGEIVGGAVAFDCVGIIQHTVDPYIGYKFIGGGDDSVSPAIVQDVVSRDADLTSWVHFTGFIQSLKSVHQTTTLDMMACALYANPDWKYVIDTLAVRENITIRASLDNTGSSANDDDANWVLETDNVSLTTVYFTDKIYAWKYVLATYIDTRFNALRWNNPIETDNHTGMFASRAYDARLKIAAGTNNFTIEAWYYEPTTRLMSTIVDMGNYNYLFQIRTVFSVNPVGGLNFYNNSIAWNHSSSSTITPGQWNHVAITRSGSTFTFYVNGIARQTFTNSASLQSNDSTFAIGMQSPDNCSCNKMKLDTVLYDIRLWNVARTANEIRMFRNRVVPANSTGLVANYLCTDNGSTFNDRTSNSLHATLQSYDASRWSNTTVPIPNMGFLISNNYSLRTTNTGTALNALTHFDNITHTDFTGVDLSGVNFRGADLTGCNFTNANLTNTDFTNATVLNIITTNATTTGSNLSSAITNMSAEYVLTLDGADDAVNLFIPTWTYSTQFRTTMTVECWFKTADTNNLKIYTTLVSRNSTGGSSGNSQFSIYMLSTGEVGFGLTNNSDTGSYHNTTQTYKDALWHHVAVTYDSSTGVKSIYIDGALSRSDSVPSGFGLLSENTFQRLVIGSDDYAIATNSADRQFRGSISDVRIWNVARTVNQIADNYRNRLIGNETGLVGYWKLNQGRGSGWGSYSDVMDSTTSQSHGSIVGAGATPSGSWVVSNLKFQPRVSALTLGANNGVYNFSDSSFSFIDPSSNSLGNFSYSVSPSSVATIANGASTMKTIYSLSAANLAPTYTLYEFPVLADLTNWQIDISFTVTGNAGTWRALIGDMNNNINNTSRGWGLCVSSSNGIHWSWVGATAEPATISVSLHIPYVLTVAQNSGTITLTLRTVSTPTDTQTGSFPVGANAIGRGPVTIGGWHNSNFASENFPGTISYVNVSVPTNQRLVSFSSATDAGTPATVTAIQDSSFDFGAGSQTANLTVNKVAPTIDTWSITTKNFGEQSFSLSDPTSNSGGAFTYTNSSHPEVATVSLDGTVFIVGAGSTTITATQAASPDGNYNAGSVTAVLVVYPIAPTIDTWSITTKNFGEQSFSLSDPTSNSGGAFTYTNSSHPEVATVSLDGTVTIVGAGSTTITATQAASPDGNYTGGSTVSATLTVTAELSNFTVPTDKKYGDASFDLTDPTSIYDGEPFTFSSSAPTIASIGGADGRTVSIHLAGSTIITATQAATGAHGELSISATLIISKKTPVITVAAGSIAKNYGNASFNIELPSSTNTDAGSGGGGAFSYSSRNTSIVSIIDTSYVSITGVGSTIIDVTQSATDNFTEAVSSISITVSKGTPVLSVMTVAANKTYGSLPFSALAYPSSASAGDFIYSSSDENVATIDSSSGVITLLAAGYVNFTATQAATALYNSASKTSNTMTVHRQILPLVRSSPTTEIINKTYGDTYFNVVAANASNGGTITYETDNPSVAGIVGLATAGIISVVTVGTATITARRGDTPQYSSHPVSWTVEVGRATTSLTGLSDLSYNVTAAPFSVSASNASDGAVSYSLQDPTSDVLTIHPTTGLVTLRAPGSAVIVASQAQGTLYKAPASITATITVSSAGNALQGATITNTTSFESVNLSGASLAGVSITNTTFESANLNGSNMTNAVITNANFGNANLSGVSLTGAIITGATFTAVSLTNADLSGAIVSNTVFTGADLSGARLTRVDASGSSFANASLSNVDLTGANITNTNFTNTNIKGANITNVSFSDVQKLQLLKNSENREIPQVILTEVPGTTVLSVVSESSPLRSVANLNLASSTLKVIIPQTSPSPAAVIQNLEIDVNSGSTLFYLPINESEYFKIQDIKYYASAGVVRNYATNAVVEVIYYNGTPIWLFAGSIVGLILQANTLNSASFVVPRIVTLGTLTPFMPTTLPTSNSSAPIVYSSSHPAIASIDSSSGLITVAGNQTGEVVFTATQAQNVTHEPGVCVSNRMFVSNILNFSLIGLNQAFDLSTMATLDASSVNLDATDATAIFYVRLSDMLNVFKYQSDAFDVNNIGAQDIKYFVFHRNWPSELRINPSHAMMDQLDSLNMLGSGFSADKSLTKHDFIRHIALSLFNTIHGVDLFSNEEDLMENSVYLGETVRHNIDGILSNISTTSASEAMAYDASGNKYLTDDASGNTNLCRELMRQVAASSPLRFYNNGGDNPGIKTVPFHENDTIQFKLVMQAAIQQNLLTGVSEIPTRSYTIKLILKNTVSPFANTNTTVGDSEMYPNAFPYSTSVATYAPTADSSGVYNIYSPPAPIPFSRYGYNGWYYTNSTAWVNVEPAVRNHVKWLVGANTGSSKVGDLQYIRFNLKIHNKSALPYLMIYTDAGSSRKYPVVGGSASLTNGELYSFYMNFNSYGREPAVIGHTNAALAYTIGSGAFANTEGITNIALETDSNAAAGNVDFTLMSIVVGELSTTTGATTEREYGFQAAVLDSYP